MPLSLIYRPDSAVRDYGQLTLRTDSATTDYYVSRYPLDNGATGAIFGRLDTADRYTVRIGYGATCSCSARKFARHRPCKHMEALTMLLAGQFTGPAKTQPCSWCKGSGRICAECGDREGSCECGCHDIEFCSECNGIGQVPVAEAADLFADLPDAERETMEACQAYFGGKAGGP